MQRTYYVGNRERLYQRMDAGSLLAVFSGEELWKTGDEKFPFFADRNFVYLTGLKCRSTVLLAAKDSGGSVQERLYLLPPDAMAERWTGTRVKPKEAEAISGVSDIRPFPTGTRSDRAGNQRELRKRLMLDLYRFSPEQPDRRVASALGAAQNDYPYLRIGNAEPFLRELRLIKQPCEIEALRQCGIHHA